MADFAESVDMVLRAESGYVDDDPVDHGGATNFGVSLSFYKSIKKDATSDDIKKLTPSMAKEIFRKSFWQPNKYEFLTDQDIANKMLSMCVLMGPVAANRCLQRALHAVASQVAIDGVVGSKTLYAANSSNPLQLLAALKSESAGQLRIIVLLNQQYEKYIEGWLNRAYF